jgi:hypothetical protein
MPRGVMTLSPCASRLLFTSGMFAGPESWVTRFQTCIACAYACVVLKVTLVLCLRLCCAYACVVLTLVLCLRLRLCCCAYACASASASASANRHF